MTQICVSKLTIIGPDNGLPPGRRQAIICTNVGILLTGTLKTKFNEIFIKIHIFSFKKIHSKFRLENGSHFVSASMCSLVEAEAKWTSFCRWNFQMRFLYENYFFLHFDPNFTEICSQWSKASAAIDLIILEYSIPITWRINISRFTKIVMIKFIISVSMLFPLVDLRQTIACCTHCKV